MAHSMDDQGMCSHSLHCFTISKISINTSLDLYLCVLHHNLAIELNRTKENFLWESICYMGLWWILLCILWLCVSCVTHIFFSQTWWELTYANIFKHYLQSWLLNIYQHPHWMGEIKRESGVRKWIKARGITLLLNPNHFYAWYRICVLKNSHMKPTLESHTVRKYSRPPETPIQPQQSLRPHR